MLLVFSLLKKLSAFLTHSIYLIHSARVARFGCSGREWPTEMSSMSYPSLKDAWPLGEKESSRRILTVKHRNCSGGVKDKMQWGTADSPGEGQCQRESHGVSEAGRNCSAAKRWKSILGQGNRLCKGWKVWRHMLPSEDCKAVR